jgi:hypothetical protein
LRNREVGWQKGQWKSSFVTSDSTWEGYREVRWQEIERLAGRIGEVGWHKARGALARQQRGVLAALERCAGKDREVRWQRLGYKHNHNSDLRKPTVLKAF